MYKHKFEGTTIRAAGLFPSARHDWMNYHSTDVNCNQSGCFGHLKWSKKRENELTCVLCGTLFILNKKTKAKSAKQIDSRAVRLED